MKKTETPIKTPSPHTERPTTAAEVGSETNTVAEFLSAALTMSWQLALTVLIPIIGGLELGRKLHAQALLITLGFIIAITGASLIIWRQYRLVKALPIISKSKESRT